MEKSFTFQEKYLIYIKKSKPKTKMHTFVATIITALALALFLI